MRVKMSKQPPPAPTASAVGPCPTVIQIVGRPGTGSLPSTIAPPPKEYRKLVWNTLKSCEDILQTAMLEPSVEKECYTHNLERIYYEF